VAPLAAWLGGGTVGVSLGGAARMLGSGSTRFPVYAEVPASFSFVPAGLASAPPPPSFTWPSQPGNEQHFLELESGCATAGPNAYDNASLYPDEPAGYDGWTGCSPDGVHFNFSYDYPYYVVAVPPKILDAAVVHSAVVNAQETYTSSCSVSSDVTLSWTGGFIKGTTWNTRPGVINDQDTQAYAADNLGPDPKTQQSCNTVDNPAVAVKHAFSVVNAISRAVQPSQEWPAFTFRLWEKTDGNFGAGGGNRDAFKRFARNPDLVVQYDHRPDVPDMEMAAENSQGNGSVGCHTTTSGVPTIGNTASVHGPFMFARFRTPDGSQNSLLGTFRYWQVTSGSPAYQFAYTPNSLNGAGAFVPTQISASWVSALPDGSTVGWQAQATDGELTSGWSTPCYFIVSPKTPDPPTLAVTTASPQSGGQVQLTITAPANDLTADKFVWALDQTAPQANIPAAQECTTSGPTAACTKVTGTQPSATLTITVPSPGPHDVNVYAIDHAGNSSQPTDGSTSTQSFTFDAAADPVVTCGSFAAALASNCSPAPAVPFGSTMIAAGPASCGAAAGDGTGNQLAPGDLTADGWAPGGSVTIDGASFTLPGFGSSCTAPDNVLADRQVIGMPPGSQGNAVVFLAASTDGILKVPPSPGALPGQGTGVPGNGPVGSDVTVPQVPGGIAVTGSGCTGLDLYDANEGCNPASGTITYAGSCAQTSYTLTVPDWVSGPPDTAAVILPHVAAPGGQQNQTVKLYAFAVPATPGCQITSVQLPDVGGSVLGQPVAGVSYVQPALHIFGISVRNTTTATPVQPPAAAQAAAPCAAPCSSPSQQGWTGAFASPVETGYGPVTGGFGNQTIRMAVSPNISAPAGARLRIRLESPGWMSGDGDGQIVIGDATVAPESSGPVPASAPAELFFGGGAQAVIPAGGDVYSDPLTLPFAVQAGQNLLVSLWVKNGFTGAPPAFSWLPGHAASSGASQWVSAAPASAGTSGDNTADTTGTPFPGSSWTVSTSLLTDVDVTTPVSAIGGVTSPGAPTVVVAGNNVTDAFGATTVAGDFGSPSIRVAGQLAGQPAASGFGVVDAGIQSNQVTGDSAASGGASLLARADRDILAEPDVGTVIIDEGLQDLLQAGNSATAETSMEDGYAALISQLGAFGVNVIVADVTPCSGYNGSGTPPDACTYVAGGISVETNRTDVNTDIGGGGLLTPSYCPEQFDPVGDQATPEKLLPAAAIPGGDPVNLAAAGYSSLAGAVTSSGCTLGASSSPLPSVP
jgi:hypothetical protein